MCYTNLFQYIKDFKNGCATVDLTAANNYQLTYHVYLTP